MAKKQTENRIKSEDFNLVKKPCITEKASFLAEKNFYTFEVAKNANKIEIKDFIEKKYNVNVVLVRIINVPKNQNEEV